MPTLPLEAVGGSRDRTRAWALFVAGALAVFAWASASGVRAQEPAKGDAPKAEAPAPKADDAAPPAAAPAASNAPAEGTTPGQSKNMLVWAYEASGLIGVFLFFISMYLTALVIRLFMELRVSEAVPPALVDRLETAIKEKKFQEAYDACRDNDSMLARLVRTGVANLPNGKPEAKEAMGFMSEEILTGLEQRISYLAIIGQLGPMIGLVGTIWGMIMSFREIATAAGAQPRPEKVAEGISTALFITLEGVALAVPAIFFFAFFRNRIAGIMMESMRVSERVINSLVTAAKQAKAA